MEKSFYPKVSIVIPIYNGEDYMKEAIESAVAQSYDNLEIILVNDGSKDNTHNICEDYQKKYPKLIKYIKKENGGVSTALNAAIENMSGDYFSWLSHDDLYFPQKVETQVGILNAFLEQGKDIKKIILYSNYELINKKGKHITSVVFDSVLLNKKPAYSVLRGCINGITPLIPKEAFEKVGMFDETKRTTQDYDLWMRFIKDYTFYHHEDILTKTRLHKKQTTNTSKVTAEEGNKLWLNICEMLNDSEKEELDGSLYNYYQNMYTFLKTHTNNEGAIKYCEDKLNGIKEKTEGEIAKNHILVTVVMPYYKESEEELERAVVSVLNQTYPNIEILIINDSGDSENIVLNNVLNKYKDSKNIKVIHNEENRGVSYSRNIGIQNAEGEYIALLDCDDEFLSEKTEKQLHEMLLSNAVFSHTSYIRVLNGRDGLMDAAKMNTSGNTNIISGCMVASSTVMLNKRQVGYVRYREDLRVSEDHIFYLELFMKNENYLAIDDILAKVYINSKSSAFVYENMIQGAHNVFNYLIESKYYIKYLKEFLLFTAYYQNTLNSRNKIAKNMEDFISYDGKTMLEKMIYHYRLHGFRYLIGVIFRKILRTIKGQEK